LRPYRPYLFRIARNLVIDRHRRRKPDVSLDETNEAGEALLDRVAASKLRHVVLTGGEPLLPQAIVPFCQNLRRRGLHVTIETAGTLYLPVVCDLMSISPKLSNSTPSPERDPRWTWRHEMNRHAPEVIERLIAEYDYQIKFVIEEFVDCEEVESYLAAMPKIDRARVMLMPQGIDLLELGAKNQWLEPYCARQGLIFCPRKHIEWFGAGRGK
ncbi:MAG: hypothetical protein ACWGMZ_12220, partial [Thermoguttaceae bacterium]